MILVLEGPNGVGKTTVARLVAEWLGLAPILDPGRHVAAACFEDWRMLFASNVRRVLDVGAFAALGDWLVDRWVLSSMVCDGARGHFWDPTLLRDLARGAHARVFLLDAGPEVVARRLGARGERFDPLRVRAQVLAFRDAAADWARVGGDVRTVDAGRAPEEVADAIRADW